MQKFNEYLEKFTAFFEKANEDTGIFAENCTRVEIDKEDFEGYKNYVESLLQDEVQLGLITNNDEEEMIQIKEDGQLVAITKFDAFLEKFDGSDDMEEL